MGDLLLRERDESRVRKIIILKTSFMKVHRYYHLGASVSSITKVVGGYTVRVKCTVLIRSWAETDTGLSLLLAIRGRNNHASFLLPAFIPIPEKLILFFTKVIQRCSSKSQIKLKVMQGSWRPADSTLEEVVNGWIFLMFLKVMFIIKFTAVIYIHLLKDVVVNCIAAIAVG
jgi:hypothetical protein